MTSELCSAILSSRSRIRARPSCRRELGGDLGDPLVDVALRADQKERPAEGDHGAAVTDDPHLDVLAVDLGAVGALEVGEDELVLVVLELEVVAADPLVVELDRVASSRPMVIGVGISRNTRPRSGAVQDAERDVGHGREPVARGRLRIESSHNPATQSRSKRTGRRPARPRSFRGSGSRRRPATSRGLGCRRPSPRAVLNSATRVRSSIG